MDDLNLKSLQIQSDSYDYATRIIPVGKDGLDIKSINGGKNYVENYQYTNKIKTIYWVDDRYTVKEHLLEDAKAKLKEVSKPFKSYSADVLNLAKLNNKYKNILDYKLGDTITLISKDNKVKDKQRIVKIVEYPLNHAKDTVELANTMLKFEDIQMEFKDTSNTVNNICSDNGTVKGKTIDSIKAKQISDFEESVGAVANLDVINTDIKNLHVNKADIQDLNVVKANIGELNVTKANITDLKVVKADIDNLAVNKADITDLKVTNGIISNLESTTAKIETLVNGNLTSENIQSGGISSDSLTIKDGFIKNAMVDNIDVNKINAGEISTNKFKIKSVNGGVEIVGSTQQFRDKNNNVRIQMGQDNKGDFNFIIKAEDGKTVLIDGDGIKENAIANDLIKNNMIAENAVGGKQIDYSSFATEFNKDSNTNTIKAAKVQLDDKNQTLDIAFGALETKTTENVEEIKRNTTKLEVQQGQINATIETSKILDGKQKTLEDNYNRTVVTVDSLKNTIGEHKTKIDSATGKITDVETKTNVLERDLNSFNSKLVSAELEVKANKDSIKNVNEEVVKTKSKVSGIEQNLDSISSKVSNTEVNVKKINDKVVDVDTRLQSAEQKITKDSITGIVKENSYTKEEVNNKVSKVEQTVKDWTVNLDGSKKVKIDESGLEIFNGAVKITNILDETVLHGDSNGNLVMNGEMTTNSPIGQLALKGNTLKGYLPTEELPTFSCGIWNPNEKGNVGFVSVGQTNSDYSDDNGCLWMSPIKGDGDKKAVLEYSRAVDGNRYNMINGRMEFAASGSVSVITHGVNQPFMGLWINNEGYLYPYKGNEYLGSASRRWSKAYFGDAYGTTWNGNSTRRIKSGIEYLTKRNEENISRGYMFLKSNQPVEADYKKEDFYEFVRDINYATFIYDTEKAKNNGIETLNRKDNSDKITCGFILEDMANIPNKVKDLIIKPHFDNNGNRVEGENENYIDLNSYYNILGVALQQAIERIDKLENEIKNLKTNNERGNSDAKQ